MSQLHSAISNDLLTKHDRLRHNTTWISAIGSMACYLLVINVYYRGLGASGELPLNADSIGIPIYSSYLFILIVAPFVLGVTRLALRRDCGGGLFVWRRDRPIRSITLTLISVALVVMLILPSIQDFTTPGLRDWERSLAFMTMLPALWVVLIRAALVS